MTTGTTATTGTSGSTASIVQTLGAGSGIDTGALVAALVQAQFAGQHSQLTAKTNTATAEISSVAKLQSGITGFASAVGSLVKGGSLATQPISSDSTVLNTSRLPGAQLGDLSASIEVTRLATAQSATTTSSFASRSAVVGTGNLTLTFGVATVSGGAMTAFSAGSSAPLTIAVDAAHQTVDGVAQAINAARAGVTATVVTDVDGTARITLKGTTGSAQAFTLSGDSSGLAQLAVGVGTTTTSIGSTAQNAALSLDGVAVERATNSISDLIDGVRIDLVAASVGHPVTLSGNRPTSALSQAVSDFVDTFNQLHSSVQAETDPATGSLHNDPAAASLSNSLRSLTLTPLVTDAPVGAPRSLAEIGVATNRDGSISVNSTQLAAAIAKWPDVIEEMFADGGGTQGSGISRALGAISTAATDTTYGLGASTARYTKTQSTLSDQAAMISDAEAAAKTQLTQQFAAMDARVAAYKATQAFLQGQIDAWNQKTA